MKFEVSKVRNRGWSEVSPRTDTSKPRLEFELPLVRILDVFLRKRSEKKNTKKENQREKAARVIFGQINASEKRWKRARQGDEPRRESAVSPREIARAYNVTGSSARHVKELSRERKKLQFSILALIILLLAPAWVKPGSFHKILT